MIEDNIIILVSVTLLISYVSSVTYAKTKIPDIILLMIFGVIVGPVLGLFDKELFLRLAPMMSVLALSIILFEAGINSDIVEILQTMAKSTLLAVFTILSVMVLVGLALAFFMPGRFNLTQGMLLGAMIGGTSTVAVFGILDGIGKYSGEFSSARIILTMESIVSDPICIIASITLIRMIMQPGISLIDSVKNIFSTFILSSIIGLAIGLFWAQVLDKIRTRKLIYMITLSVLLPTYLLAEKIVGGGGGAMSALTFGLAISNYKYIADKVGLKNKITIDSQKLRDFHEEVTFFIKSFFFVYIGVVVSLSLYNMLTGILLVGFIMLIRYLVASIVGGALSFTRTELTLTRFIFAAGLPSFVMAQLPLIFDPTGRFFPDTAIYANLCMPIVFGTVVFSAFFGSYMIKRNIHI
jgi:cell volume regulation protein A